jgi:carbon-monoxide dehydrogenase medium subunit
MKPPRFEFWSPSTVKEAVGILADLDDPGDAKIMAGGQSLMPLLNLRLAQPRHIVDLNRVEELFALDCGSDSVEIGAMSRQRVVERSDEVQSACPLVTQALELIGHPQIRNRGTVGGSMAHADPAAELPAVALCLDADLVAVGPQGRRTIPAAEFFIGFLSTALAEDEVLVSIRFPRLEPGVGTAFVEVARRSGDFAMAGVAATVRVHDGSIAETRIALSGVGPSPVRARTVEAAINGQRLSDAVLDEAAAATSASLDPPSDLHASADYRRHVAGVLVRRALTAAAAHAGVTFKAAKSNGAAEMTKES